MIDAGGSQMENSTKMQGEVTSRGFREQQSDVKPVLGSRMGITQCPFKITKVETERVQVAIDLVAELFRIGKSRLLMLDDQKKVLERKLVGLKFNLEDRITATKEAEVECTACDHYVEDTKLQFEELSKEIECMQKLLSLVEISDQHLLLQVRLEQEQQAQCSLKARLESGIATQKIAQGTFKMSKKRVLQGEVLCQETEENALKLEARILEEERNIVAMDRQLIGACQQVNLMGKGGGLSCWPKPTLHPVLPVEDSVPTHIQVRPCGYCKRWYHCFDLVITSCKHNFHPFCLDESLKTTNNCITCGQILHPNWWTSFGFRAQDDNMQAHAQTLKLDEVHRQLLEAIRAPSVQVNHPRAVSEIKQTELGSTCSLYAPDRRQSIGAESGVQFGLLPNTANLRVTPPTSTTRAPGEVNSPFRFKKGENETTETYDGDEFFIYQVPEVTHIKEPRLQSSAPPLTTSTQVLEATVTVVEASEILLTTTKTTLPPRTLPTAAVIQLVPKTFVQGELLVPQTIEKVTDLLEDNNSKIPIYSWSKWKLDVTTESPPKRTSTTSSLEIGHPSAETTMSLQDHLTNEEISITMENDDQPASEAAVSKSPRCVSKKKGQKRKEWAPTKKSPKRSWGLQFQDTHVLRSTAVETIKTDKNKSGVSTRSRLGSN